MEAHLRRLRHLVHPPLHQLSHACTNPHRSTEHDQELESLLVGPIPTGVNKFIFEADPPNVAKLPSSEVLGVTVVLLTCAYDGREFVRVGYYVNNEYDSEELQNEPPKTVLVDRVVRNMLAEKPRVTRFAIKWYGIPMSTRVRSTPDVNVFLCNRDSEDSAPSDYPPEQPGVDDAEDDGELYGAEEVAHEDAVVELETAEATVEGGEDVEMGGADDTAGPVVKEDEGEESEDLEAESSGESDEEEEADEEEAPADQEMGDVPAAPVAAAPQK